MKIIQAISGGFLGLFAPFVLCALAFVSYIDTGKGDQTPIRKAEAQHKCGPEGKYEYKFENKTRYVRCVG